MDGYVDNLHGTGGGGGWGGEGRGGTMLVGGGCGIFVLGPAAALASSASLSPCSLVLSGSCLYFADGEDGLDVLGVHVDVGVAILRGAKRGRLVLGTKRGGLLNKVRTVLERLSQMVECAVSFSGGRCSWRAITVGLHPLGHGQGCFRDANQAWFRQAWLLAGCPEAVGGKQLLVRIEDDTDLLGTGVDPFSARSILPLETKSLTLSGFSTLGLLCSVSSGGR